MAWASLLPLRGNSRLRKLLVAERRIGLHRVILGRQLRDPSEDLGRGDTNRDVVVATLHRKGVSVVRVRAALGILEAQKTASGSGRALHVVNLGLFELVMRGHDDVHILDDNEGCRPAGDHEIGAVDKVTVL